MFSSITEYIKEHLDSMYNYFYFSYQNIDLVTNQIYHYFTSPSKYYEQFNLPFFKDISLDNNKTSSLIKLFEISFISSIFYCVSDYNESYLSLNEKNIHDQLEIMTLKQVIEHFYDNPIFAKEMIKVFIQSNIYSKEEIDLRQQRVIHKGKGKILANLYYPIITDLVIDGYYKTK